MEPSPDSASVPAPTVSSERIPPFLIVGVGASAGGIEALTHFFDHLPAAPEMAFVVIIHLSPEYESNLAAVLQPHTPMPVVQATDAITVEPNHVYVIPPAKHLAMTASTIQLVEPGEGRAQRAPIDYFFRTLAETHTTRAAGVVLSGSGADGAIGLPRIKELGGVTMAQDPSEAQHSEMPQNAIATGVVDYVLPVAEMAGHLMSYWQNVTHISLPVADEAGALPEVDHLTDILALLRTRTGHNFAAYKQATVLRRLERRMQVNGLTTLADYLRLLRQQPGELQALLRDLLISVTNFFRDPEAWDVLRVNILPRLFVDRDPQDPVRVWVAGCATGEEAYSVAMLLHDHARRLGHPPRFQIFATDLDERAIGVAREGSYPETISLDVSAERLRQFFTHEGGRYHIRKEVRDTVLFAVHDVLKDPPFSRLDLITCRNLLIYLNKAAQEQLMLLFHFALKPEACLFLGMSESIDGVPQLFSLIDKRYHIFARRDVPRTATPLPTLPPGRAPLPTFPMRELGTPAPVTPSAGDLHSNLLEQYAPPSVVVNENYDIVHLSNRAGRYMQFAGGEPSYNLIRVIHPDLRLDLRTALYTALHKGKSNETRRIALRIDGVAAWVRIIVQPVQEPPSLRGFALVIFDEIEEAPAGEHAPGGDEIVPLARQLEEEAQLLREQLRVTIEQYETSVEELRASNEELQAMNEELRSTTEELETSKEELQAVNEELLTVNQELKSKVDEVSHINSDLQNLMISTDIATIFLDRALRIKRYTPQIQHLFNLIPADINRPLDHVTHKLNYGGLLDDAHAVLQRLTVIEREIQTSDDEWYLMRLLPYRTTEDKIDGVVATFVNITERARSAQERERLLRSLEEQQARFEAVVQQMPAGLIIAAAPSRAVIYHNAQAARLWGLPQDLPFAQRAPGFHADGTALVPADWPLARAMERGETVVNEEITLDQADGQRATVLVSAAPIYDTDGQISMAVMTTYNVTAHKQMERELRESADLLEERVAARTEELAESNEALRVEGAERQAADAARLGVLRQLVTAQEDEQRRIARELHDQLGQSLTGLRFILDVLARRAEGPQQAQLTEATGIVDDLIARVSELSLNMRPAVLDDLGLLPAVASLIERWSQQTGLTVVFRHSGLHERLDPVLETTIYRIVQEALTNITRHSGATEATVEIESNIMVEVCVADNGKGFDPVAARRAGGLLGMRERAALAGGELIIESAPGGGTSIRARFPAQTASPEETLAPGD